MLVANRKPISAKSTQYWRDRSEYLQTQLLHKGDDFCRETAKQFDIAINNIEKEISAFYGRFAENNQISYVNAQRMLTTHERNAYRMDVKEYIEKGQTLNYSQEWAHDLENASTVHRVTRLQALQTRMRQEVETAYSDYAKGMAETAKDIFTDGYYHNIYEVQKGYGQGNPFTQLDTAKVEKVIARPWTPDGKNFSDKIWEDKDKLLNTLHTKLSQAFIRGDDVRKLAKDLSDACGVSKSNAMRLIQTEAAYFAAAADLESYTELGVKQCQILATLDMRTSQICQDMDGKIIDLDQYEPGVTVPPFHPWCRSTTVPYFEDETGLRVARDLDGKTYEVSSDMSYSEWYDKYAKNPTETLNAPVSNENGESTGDEKTTFNPVKAVDAIKYDLPDAPKWLKPYVDYHLKDDSIEIDTNINRPYQYDQKRNKICVNPAHADFDYYDSKQAILHEFGHMLDMQVVEASQSSQFLEAIQESSLKAMNKQMYYQNLLFDSEYGSDMAISDIMSALTNTLVFGDYHHPPNYWSSNVRISAEIFANIFEIVFSGDEKRISFIENEFSKLYSMFLALFKKGR